jgi:hypothetical protein
MPVIATPAKSRSALKGARLTSRAVTIGRVQAASSV